MIEAYQAMGWAPALMMLVSIVGLIVGILCRVPRKMRRSAKPHVFNGDHK